MRKHKSYHRTIMTKHTLAMMLGTTSSTNGSNTRDEPGERDAPRFLICVRTVNVKAYGDRGRIQRMGELRHNGPIGFGISGRRGDSVKTHTPQRHNKRKS